MLAHLEGFRAGPSSPVPEVYQAIKAVRSDCNAHLLGYTAVARVNPYQAMLYSAFGDHSVAAAPVLRGFDFSTLNDFHRLTRTRTVHFHWINWIIGDAPDEQTARNKARGMLARVDRFRDRGGKVAWTVHNVYPHDAKFVDVELELQQGLADRADAVHVMARATTTAMDGILRVPSERMVVAPHPSYVDAYESFISRSDARAALGIDSDEIVFVLFGALKQYKGLNQLLDGFQELCRRDTSTRYRLVVAGHPDEHPEVRDFVDRCVIDPSVLIAPQRIPGNKAQYYLKAADAGLVTYTRSLNSGAALLYLSFGLPVLATDTPVFHESLPQEHVTFISDPGERTPAEYADRLMALHDQAPQSGPADVLASIAHLAPTAVSSAFCQDLGRLLRW